MRQVITIAVLIILSYLAWFVIPRWRMRRAVKKVIGIFRLHHATDAKAAKTLEELRLKSRRDLVHTLLLGRDFKVYALQGLIKAQVILKAPGGRYYLQEDKVAQIGFE